jgi:hypothetical protein
MSYIIIVDMRESNGQIVAISRGNTIAQWETEEEAEEIMSEHPLNVFPYKIIDMGEGE